MPIQYQPTREQRHYARFGLVCPPQAAMVRPGEQGLFIRQPRGDRELSVRAAARFEAAPGRWGLIPLFSKDPDVPYTHEARGETAAGERNFYQPWKRGHRCVILVDAIYRRGKTDETMVRVCREDGEPVALAGLWNGWRSPTGECVESFALLTLAAQEDPAERRAVFLREAWIDDWLYCPVEETSAYLRPYDLNKLVRDVIPRDESVPLPATAPAI
jgi:putative SOS response-associated peptidase YedK